jgi:transcriptional regulator with XRE-family HTH domain
VPLDPLPDWVLTRRRAIGGRIRDAREHANLTQWTLGEAIGRDNKTIHRFEYALSVPTLTDLLLIADACGTTVADLLAE